jgi:hypothetical protein
MTTMIIKSADVRVPKEARQAVAEHRPVEVRVHDRAEYVLVNARDFAFVRPMLERRLAGRPVPVEDLLTDDDFEILAAERAADSGLALDPGAGWA